MIEDIKYRAAVAKECYDAIQRRLDDVDRMGRFDPRAAHSIMNKSRIESSVVSGELLQEILLAGVEVVTNRKIGQMFDLERKIASTMNPDREHAIASDEREKCEACHGLGTPSGEAAGLVCGACNGTGIESGEDVD